ncbi:DGQHR domain-containing protein [Enterococcus faecium]|uniref:DGQHR domain-containing protein n=1 Tax=Enterococcus faecium TaxID=1352 RepID=UPI001D16B3CF|nr:DGQHR domain-containing protein [Enterococcus faecium]
MNDKDVSVLRKEELLAEKRERRKEYHTISVPFSEVESLSRGGWIVDREFKTKVRLKKMKSGEELLANRIWLLFYNMGFNKLNIEKVLIEGLEVEVLCSDDETILFIFNKFSSKKQDRTSLLKDIEKIYDKKHSLIQWARSNFSKEKKKCAFVLSTQNYVLPDQDILFMEKNGITHFDEEMLLYYEGLVNHLGEASRYQLLGFLFPGQKIQGMDNKIPAIEGRMGGHKYYSFSIEPEKLLKIGYVLPRNNANNSMMPTYQRLIKKDRLKSIRSFISEGGFFPNSLIVNLDTNGKKLRFDKIGNQIEESISHVGILYLPQLYRSAYIIDGQHRLYGYSNLNFSESNSIPVVAFVNLDRKEQIKLFMDINENQKSVSKNLRNTLNSDLLWESDSLSERKTALKLLIAQKLGEDRDSPLYNRVLVGENSKTDYCCITIDFIKKALDDCSFLGEFNKNNELIHKGTLDNENNEETLDILLKYLKECLWYVKTKVEDQWETIEKEQVFIVTNPGIYSLIRIIDDITNHLMHENLLTFEKLYSKEDLKLVFDYLDYLVDYYNSITVEEKKAIKGNYGAGGRLNIGELYKRN